MRKEFANLRIEGERIRLRPIRDNDAVDIVKWANNPDVIHNFQFFSRNGPLLDEELAYIRRMNESPNDMLFRVETISGEFLGTCGLHDIDWYNDTARLGIILFNTIFWGRGYAKEAIQLLLEWAFGDKVKIHKVYLSVFTTNDRGIGLYTRLGFKKEGRLRSEYKIRGAYVDLIRMAILKEEWN